MNNNLTTTTQTRVIQVNPESIMQLEHDRLILLGKLEQLELQNLANDEQIVELNSKLASANEQLSESTLRADQAEELLGNITRKRDDLRAEIGKITTDRAARIANCTSIINRTLGTRTKLTSLDYRAALKEIRDTLTKP
jgi:chromosome segregation ATPase